MLLYDRRSPPLQYGQTGLDTRSLDTRWARLRSFKDASLPLLSVGAPPTRGTPSCHAVAHGVTSAVTSTEAFFALAKETLRTIWFNFLRLGHGGCGCAGGTDLWTPVVRGSGGLEFDWRSGLGRMEGWIGSWEILGCGHVPSLPQHARLIRTGTPEPARIFRRRRGGPFSSTPVHCRWPRACFGAMGCASPHHASRDTGRWSEIRPQRGREAYQSKYGTSRLIGGINGFKSTLARGRKLRGASKF